MTNRPPRIARIGLIFVLALAAPHPVWADLVSEASSLLDAVKKDWTARPSIEARFEQWHTFAGFDESIQARARLRVLRPSFFEISYDEPNKQRQVCDGKYLWTATDQPPQVIKTPLDARAEGSTDLFDWLLRDAVALSVSADTVFGQTARRLDLQPGPQLGLASLVVWVKAKDGGLLGYEAVDAESNRTRVHLISIKNARGLKPSDFEFTPPPGVEVIELGGSR